MSVRVLQDAERLAQVAADEILRRANGAVRASGRFAVALSGGSTPQRLFDILRERIESGSDDGLDWQRVHFFWGDERYVPRDDPASNYAAAYRGLLRVPLIPPPNVHRIRTEIGSAHQAADDYQEKLVRFFSLGKGQLPRFDLVLLGMGGDGHTASLFPGSSVVTEGRRLVAAPWIELLSASRITLTLPVFNAAAAVLFLVAGDEKADVLRRVLEEAPSEDRPASLIRPANKELLWFVDRAAASSLRGRAHE